MHPGSQNIIKRLLGEQKSEQGVIKHHSPMLLSPSRKVMSSQTLPPNYLHLIKFFFPYQMDFYFYDLR